MRKFVTNCTKLQGLIDFSEYGISVSSETAESYSQSALSGETEILKSLQQKVLGVTWCRASDELLIDLGHILAVAEDMEPTKRGVISLVSKIYDPLGLISPVVIRFKILFQELCSSKIAWVESSHWHHCQGEANPADMPSRGLTLKEMKDSQVWFYGPSWLREKSLVSMQLQDDLPPECLEELKVKEKKHWY